MGVRIVGNMNVRITMPKASTLRRVGQDIARKVVARTRAHTAPGGGRFKPYTARYAAAKGVGRGDVDLTSRGEGPHMLDAIGVVEASEHRLVVGFSDPEMADRAAHVAATRPFLAPEREWVDDAVAAIAADITIR